MHSPSEVIPEPVSDEVLRISNLLKKGEKKIVFPSHNNATIILGNIGSGKTTLAELITNNENLYSNEVNEGSGEYIIADKRNKINANSTEISKTTFPELFIDEFKNIYIDCPGFNHSSNDAYSVVHSYFIGKVLKNVKSAKFVLTATYPMVRVGAPKDDFLQLLKNFTTLFKNMDSYRDSIVLIVTKVDNTYVMEEDTLTLIKDEKIKENIIIFLKEVRDNLRTLLEKSSTDKQFHQNALNLIDVFLKNDGKNNIGIIRRPDRKGFLTEIPILQKNKQDIQNLLQHNLQYTTLHEYIDYTISDEWKNLISNLAKGINKNITFQVSKIGTYLIEYYKSQEKKMFSDDMYALLEKLQLALNSLTTLKTFDYSGNAEELIKQMVTQFQKTEVQIPTSSLRHIQKFGNILKLLERLSSTKYNSPTSEWVEGLSDAYSDLENSKLWYELLQHLHSRLGEYKIIMKFQNDNVPEFGNVITDESEIWDFENIPGLMLFIEQLKCEHDWSMPIFSQQLKKMQLNKTKLLYLDSIIQSTLKPMVQDIDGDFSLPDRTVVGDVLRLSEITDKFWDNSEINSLAIYADTIFVDSDLRGSKDLFLFARRWHIVGMYEINLITSEGSTFSGSSWDWKGRYFESSISWGSFFGIGQIFENAGNLTIQVHEKQDDTELYQGIIDLSENGTIPKFIKNRDYDYNSQRTENNQLYLNLRARAISEYRKYVAQNLKSCIKKRTALQLYPYLWENYKLRAMDNNEVLMSEILEAEKYYQHFNSNVNQLLYDSFLDRTTRMRRELDYKPSSSLIRAVVQCKLIRLRSTTRNQLLTSYKSLYNLLHLFRSFKELEFDKYYDEMASKRLKETKQFLYSNLFVTIENLISSNNDRITQLVKNLTDNCVNDITNAFAFKYALKSFETMGELLRFICYWIEFEFEKIKNTGINEDVSNFFTFSQTLNNDSNTYKSKISLKIEELQHKYEFNVNPKIVLDALIEERKLLESKGYCNHQCRDLKDIEIQLKIDQYDGLIMKIPIEQAMKKHDEIKNRSTLSDVEKSALNIMDKVKLNMILNDLDPQAFERVKNMNEQHISSLVGNLDNKHKLFQNFNSKILAITDLSNSINYPDQARYLLKQMKLVMNTFIDKIEIKDNLDTLFVTVDYGISILDAVLDSLPSYRERKLLNAYISYANNHLERIWPTSTLKPKHSKIVDEDLTINLLKKDILLYEYDNFLQSYKTYVFRIQPLKNSLEDLQAGLRYIPNYSYSLETLSSLMHEYVPIWQSNMNANSNDLRLIEKFSSNTNIGPFFIWKNSFHNNTITELLTGKKVLLKASITNNLQHELIAFSSLRLQFKLPTKQTYNNQTNFEQIMKDNFQIEITHLGSSTFSFCRRIYNLVEPPITYTHNISETEFINVENEYERSPYTPWYFQLKPNNDSSETFALLKPYHEYKFDLQLEGNAKYISTQNETVCDQFEKTIPFHYDFENNSTIESEEDKLISDQPLNNRKRRQIDDTNSSTSRKMFEYLKKPFKPVLDYWNSFENSSTQDSLKQITSQFEPPSTFSSIPFNLNGTLTLADFFVRCLFKTKPVPTSGVIMDLKDIRQSVLCILDGFEFTLNDLSDRYNVPIEQLQYDPVRLMGTLENELLNGNGNASKVMDILLESVSTSTLSPSEAVSFRQNLQQGLSDWILYRSESTFSFDSGKQFGQEENLRYYDYGHSSSVNSNQSIGTTDTSVQLIDS